ncbi:2,3-diaminopropionate biosynthesis protein SbnB [Paenibacillus sp. LHD-117]|uniref:2,3-diaminopropionate biosynthesis protein SbnB n=1 Tax=Paenibacillus sp. LHD-117 TaxID=3071412 RepID=UPI0027DF126C|nr:2,3-diaminopropionate biosynthesis protein SbnB [Paenibacillus sp. LHD-117]MDQ6421974.1 2,3-diaminopropionate biosynthesis protein SbnB [Paenibacillus sp. LHD-117]
MTMKAQGGIAQAEKNERKPFQDGGAPSLLYLDRETIRSLGGESSDLYVEAIEQALTLHAEGAYVQPLKPYLRTDSKDGHIADRIIAMPAHIGGSRPMSGIKWIGSKHDNPRKRSLERASGLIALNDPDSNFPIAVLEAGLISSMRTAAVTAVAARHLARIGFRYVSCIGCGLIASAQLRTLLEQFPHIEAIHLFDVSMEAAERLKAELAERFPNVAYHVEQSAESAVRQGEVVVTCTVTDTPYIPYEWLQKGTFVSNTSIMDVQKDVFLKADKVVVDDWDQSNREKKIINQLVLEGRFSREQLHAELGEIVIGQKAGRDSDDEIIILNPMGMAIEDITCARNLYYKALEANAGTSLKLY